jgi:hypothetical protein
MMVVFLLTAVCSCAVGKALSLELNPDIQRMHEARPQGLSYPVAVAPVQVYRTHVVQDKASWPLAIKDSDLQKEVMEALEAVPVFARIVYTPSSDLTAARERGADLLFQVSLKDCNTSFGGTNGYFIPNMLIWGILSPIVSAFVADEFFTVTGEVTGELLETSTGRQVWSHTFMLQERYDLNDWQRLSTTPGLRRRSTLSSCPT